MGASHPSNPISLDRRTLKHGSAAFPFLKVPARIRYDAAGSGQVSFDYDAALSKKTMTRRIVSAEHNVHVAHGVPKHRPTSVAPQGLLKPLTAEDIALRDRSHSAAIKALGQSLGKPYYEAPGFVLYNCDSPAALAMLAGTRFRAALTVTSPPYNIGKEYESRLSVEEYVEWSRRWMAAVHATTAADGSFWLNLGYFEVPHRGLCVPIPYLLWDCSDFYLIQEVVWAYGAGVSARHRLSPRNEKWLFYVRDKQKYTFNLDAIRDPNVKYPNQKKNGKFRCNPLGKNPSDVWEFPKVTTGADRSSKERAEHPAQFPLGVVERIVRASSNSGDVVVDPFSGSASTGLAAYSLGRVFVGFELSRGYCDMSIKRFENFVRERNLATKQPALL